MKESGIGRENGVEALHACKFHHAILYLPCSIFSAHRLSFYCSPYLPVIRTDSQSKSIIVNIAPPEESRVKDDWFAENEEEKRYG